MTDMGPGECKHDGDWHWTAMIGQILLAVFPKIVLQKISKEKKLPFRDDVPSVAEKNACSVSWNIREKFPNVP